MAQKCPFLLPQALQLSATLLTHPPPALHCLRSCQGWAWPAAMWEGPRGALPAQGVHSGRQRPGRLAVTCPDLGGPTGRHTLTTRLVLCLSRAWDLLGTAPRTPKLLLSIGLPGEVTGRLRAQSRPPHLLPSLTHYSGSHTSPGTAGPWGWGTVGKGDRVIALSLSVCTKKQEQGIKGGADGSSDAVSSSLSPA